MPDPFIHLMIVYFTCGAAVAIVLAPDLWMYACVQAFDDKGRRSLFLILIIAALIVWPLMIAEPP
jgi:hypothetical protein